MHHTSLDLERFSAELVAHSFTLDEMCGLRIWEKSQKEKMLQHCAVEDDLGNEEEMVKGVGAPEWEATILSLLQPVSSSDYPYHCTQGSLPVPKAQFF